MEETDNKKEKGKEKKRITVNMKRGLCLMPWVWRS
jgi:hypothetical protein